MSNTIYNMRQNYTKGELLENKISNNPFLQFEEWFNEARNAKVLEPNAMCLSTANTKGRVSSRIVLLKSFGESGFTFFTNYKSKKAKDLKTNSFASILFFWDILERQIRIEGKVEKIPEEESIRYFSTRPFESKIGAIISNQSEVITSRKILEDKFFKIKEVYEKESFIPKPKEWGGYNLIPDKFEFWQGGKFRLHDRIEYNLSKNLWKIQRLSP